MDEFLRGIIARAEENADISDDDYEVDGLLYCGKCHTPKQCRVNINGVERVVFAVCDCKAEMLEQKKREFIEHERLNNIRRLRSEGIQESYLRDNHFENADNSKCIQLCKKYADNWKDVCRENIGMLMWGDVGTGKTFAASCIANQLLENEVPVLMTSFPKILNTGFDKEQIIEQMNKYDLVIIDDLGTERQSDYALETVFYVIDERYKANKPLIVTTNLDIDVIRDESKGNGLKQARIYDRILEMCQPIHFQGSSRRAVSTNHKHDVLKKIFEL